MDGNAVTVCMAHRLFLYGRKELYMNNVEKAQGKGKREEHFKCFNKS